MTRGPLSLDNPVCVALDLPDADAIREMAVKVEEHVGVFKIGPSRSALTEPDDEFAPPGN